MTCNLDNENETAVGKNNADRRTMQVGMRKVKGQVGQCKYINDGIGITNDEGTGDTSLRYERGKTQGPIYGQNPSTLESLPLTEASPRSRQKLDPQPLHRITSLGSGHNKDCLRYQPTKHHPINSTDPTNRRPSTTMRELSGTSQGSRGATVRPQKRRRECGERGR
jgi:hypothetical protein